MNSMDKTREFLKSIGLPGGDSYDLPTSQKRFKDGGQFRFEVPGIQGPKVMKALLEAMDGYGLYLHRVTQTQGIMRLTDEEISKMVELAHQWKTDLILAIGPRATTDNPEVIQANGTAVTSENFPVTLKGEQWYIADSVNGGNIPLGVTEGPVTLKVTATEKTIEKVQEIGVQVNGKLRATVAIALDASKEDAIAAGKEALGDKIEGKQIIKEIYVPGRIINIVVKG